VLFRSGFKETYITGDNTILVSGLKTETIEGSVSESCLADRTINILGTFTETVIKEKQSLIGKRKATIATGDDILTVQLGNKIETIALNKISTVLGMASETITAGKLTTIASGAYTVSVGTGAVSITTAAGTVTITGTGPINISSTTAINVNAPKVSLGVSLAPKSGVIILMSHNDYITGAPLRPSNTVSASL
jgi:hypothetical protein